MEVKNAELAWLKFELLFLIQGSIFQKQKRLLNLYFDENDILRSETRINQIKGVVLQESQSILLRSNSYFRELIVLKCDNEVNYSGLESTFDRTMWKYWLIKGQATVKNVLNKLQLHYFLNIACRVISPIQ